jgi:hypothetical protein
MTRLPLSQLEEARQNPVAYRRKIGNPSGPRKWGYINALREAIRQFHKMGDNGQAGYTYLEDKLDRFKNERKSLDTVNQLAWYIEDYWNRGWFTTETYHNISVPLEGIGIQVRCTGEISRLDIVPSGGYAAWLFRSREPEGWKKELRMPIIQDIAAGLFGVPSSEMRVGIISFKERYADFHNFGSWEIAKAYSEFDTLIKILFQEVQ